MGRLNGFIPSYCRTAGWSSRLPAPPPPQPNRHASMGGAKWVPSKLLPDGGVVFAPFNASSILLFNPADDTYQEALGGWGFGV